MKIICNLHLIWVANETNRELLLLSHIYNLYVITYSQDDVVVSHVNQELLKI